MAKQKKQDWFDKWQARIALRRQWGELTCRYISLLIETGDQCYWDAYKNAEKIESFHRGIANRMWNYHHPERKV